LPELRRWLSSHANRAIAVGKPRLNKLSEDGCLLLARTQSTDHGKLRGIAALDLESCRIQILAFDQPAVSPKLLTAIERLAVSFGMLTLSLRIKPSSSSPLNLPGYRPVAASNDILQRNLSPRLTAQARKVLKMNQQLGVPGDYGGRHCLRLQSEPNQLASIGPDVFDREQFMTPKAATALHQLISTAATENIEIQPVSAFRSVDYQCSLLQNKLDKGQSMQEILRVSAAPGFSEHHSGRAIDLTTPGYKPLEEEFADSAAFQWLNQRAGDFGFRLSYPEGNRHGVTYEPWHWYYTG
jgi:D-alanyl-D-alanine carboxypeptidase